MPYPERIVPAIEPVPEDELFAAAVRFNDRFLLDVTFNDHSGSADAAATADLAKPESLVFWEHNLYGMPGDDTLDHDWHKLEEQSGAKNDVARPEALIAGIADDDRWHDFNHALFALL